MKRSMFALVCAMLLTTLIPGFVSAQHRVDLNPLNGNISMTYPISSRSINGQPISVALTYSANVTQYSFDTYVPAHFDPLSETPTTLIPASWGVSTRMHGVWMLSINGIVVQTFSTLPVDPSADVPNGSSVEGGWEAEYREWFTKGYDVCSRLCNPAGGQDVINILMGDGSVLELRNERLVNESSNPVYTGRYYENAINAKGFAIVEYDDSYWPQQLRDLFDNDGDPDASKRPRILRYYPGDGLEYVFREIVAPYGDPGTCVVPWWPPTSSNPKKEVGATIFYLEEINKEHSNLVTVKRSKHYPSNTNLDIAPGRALTTSFTGHYIDYGDDLVTIQSEGKTHKLILRQQDRYETLAVESTYFSSAIRADRQTDRLFPSMADTLRNRNCLYCDIEYGGPQRLQVREIISPAGDRTVFDYKPRNGAHDDVKFTSTVLTRVRDISGWTDIEINNATHTYTGAYLGNNLLGKPDPTFFNVCSTLVTHSNAPTSNTLLTTTFESDDHCGTGLITSTDCGYMNDTIAGALSPYISNKWSEIITTDHTLSTPTKPWVTVERYIWKRFTITPIYSFVPTTDLSDKLYHYVPFIYRRTFGDQQTETVQIDTTVDAGSRFNILPIEIITRQKSPTVAFTVTAKTQFDYTFEQLSDAFTVSAVEAAHRRCLKTRTTHEYHPWGTLQYRQSVATFLNLGYSSVNNCYIKDTVVNEMRSRRSIDSGRASGSTQYLQVKETVSAPVARTVRLAPLFGLYDLVVTTDSLGTILSGVDNDWYAGYECTASGVKPTYPRGGLHWSDSYGKAQPGQPLSLAPKVRTVDIDYTNSHFRMLPLRVEGVYGAESKVDYGNAQAEFDVLFNNSTTTHITLDDDDFLSDRPLSSTASVRKTDYFGTSATTQLSQGEYSTYDGTLALQRGGNHVVSSRYDDARTESTTWGPQDFPTTWKLRHPWVKLWDAQSKMTHEGVMPGCSTEVRYDNRRLVLMPKWELADPVSGCTTARSVDSKVHLKYHASSTDQLHTESSVDLGIMRLNVVELYLGDFAMPITSTIRVTFSGGGLTTPVVQEYEVVPLAYESRGSDSSKVGIFEFFLDAPVLSAMKAMSTGSTMDIDILLDTLQWEPMPYFVEFAAHGEDVAPRITGVNSSIVPIKCDATVKDFSEQSRFFTDLLKATSISKLDDAGSTPEPTTWTASLTTLDGRYTKVNGQYDAVNTTLSIGATQGNPYTSSTVSWATSKLSAGGMALTTAYPNVNLTAQTFAYDQNGSQQSQWTSSFPTPTTPSPTTLTSQTFAGTTGSLLYSESEGASVTSLTSVDLFGRVLSCSTGTGTGAQVTTFEYEPMTNLLSKVVTPAGGSITFAYDAFGRTSQISHPDLGVTKYKYDDRGLLRFVQTAMQAIPSEGKTRITYYEYDDLGRQILSGEALLASGVTFAQLDSSQIAIGSSSEPTRNWTMFSTGGTAPPIVSLKRVLNQCVPVWGASQRPPYEQFAGNILNAEAFVRPATLIPYPGDFGQFTTAATAANFENVGMFPEHPRTAVLYDEFLLDQVNNRLPGNIWGGLPRRTSLECLTPTGSFRNLSGRAVAVAYRDHGKDKFWYKVYSYDEKGRIECEIRIDDNLGIGVSYFTYNDAGSPICIRQVDAIRNHATWYAYDDNGRVAKLWTALSAPGALNGLGPAAQDNDQTVRCYSTMSANFVARPANPDVTYAYDALGRLTGKVYNNADVAGNITEALDYNWRLALERKQAIVAGMPIKNIADQTLTYQDDMQVSVNSLDGRGTNDRITNETYDDKGRLITTLSTPDPNNTYTLDPLSRRTQTVKSWLTPLPPPEVNNYVYMPVNTWISAVYDPAPTLDYIAQNWDANGRVATRTIGSFLGTVTETTSFGYHDRLLNLVLAKPAPTEVPCPLTTLNEGNNYSLNDTWTYRYGPGGIREQKRLMTSPQHDRMPCGVAPWVAYVLSPGGQQLAVYHGRQVSESSCTPAGFGPYERRVHIYPVEFRSYGPDGINVIFERNAGGVMTKRFVTTNNQGSIVSVTDNAGYEASAVYDNFGSPTNAYTGRTGWLDRERDFETSPLSDKHKLYDLEARKYDASTGQFLSVDPLWMHFLSSSSYVYCEGDPVNGTDPWGLAGDGDPKGPGGPSKPDGTTTTVTEWFQRYFSVYGGGGGSNGDEERARRAQEEVAGMGSGGSGGVPSGGAWTPPARKQPSTPVKGKGIPGPYRIPPLDLSVIPAHGPARIPVQSSGPITKIRDEIFAILRIGFYSGVGFMVSSTLYIESVDEIADGKRRLQVSASFANARQDGLSSISIYLVAKYVDPQGIQRVAVFTQPAHWSFWPGNRGIIGTIDVPIMMPTQSIELEGTLNYGSDGQGSWNRFTRTLDLR
jgi:RHS repeat-associated protein